VKLTLHNRQQGHQAFKTAWEAAKDQLQAGKRLVLEVREETRTLEQNRCMWAYLTDIAKQVNWYGRKLTPEQWKEILSASLRKQEVVPGIDGGFVVLGQSTSKMTIAEMSEMIELSIAFGEQHDVKFSAKE
jgi:NinB protein